MSARKPAARRRGLLAALLAALGLRRRPVPPFPAYDRYDPDEWL